MAAIRLDKLLAQSGERSRSDAAKLVRAGCVTVDGQPVRDPAAKADAELSRVLLNGQAVTDEAYRYYLFHKPAGVLTAARDRSAQTVMDLVPPALAKRDVLPVGRLDKDTTGLLLLTNDGELAHRLLSPKRHVWKEYLVAVDGPLTTQDVEAFACGMELSDFTAKPAELTVLSTAPDGAQAVVRLAEGKFHQVKRMFAARGRNVLTLHRQAFGPLKLDVPEGTHRPLTEEEIAALHLAAQG